ncbi:MAG: hypothetical protein JWN66_4269 [Sphingomonas bacterium]|uniref:hypothetical protein n=1 Tax=Sphingomonas bacterium TaxID=1895847 RepID=UPI002618CB0E|nr:hypothetical protein [Sphingomonas bacterium]MDB5707153.1 hypothetical protein [Sphingomonas bacterium]
MLKAALAWLLMFAISAMLARGAAWRTAFQLTMPFPAYDDEAIYKRMKGRVFTGTWLLCAVISATLVAGAMLVDEMPMLIMSLSGIILITVVTALRGYQLFRLALLEMKLPWPPGANE